MNNNERNTLGSAPVNKLLVKFAVPSIIAMIVSALYNIVDQLFIGRSVGTLGNAATNIVYPLSTSCIALALLLGIGGASAFNIAMGAGKKEDAAYYIGNAAALLILSGVILCLIVQLFTRHLLKFFGAPDDVMPYAASYTYIVSFGFPFLIFATGGGHLIRADGSPKYTMICNLTGALINTILDPLLIFGLDLGMAGAAIATIIGQICSAILVLGYICYYKTVNLKKKHFKIKPQYTKKIISLGASPFINQIAMMTTQIIMNQSLTYYGALSPYGEAIPLACSGIIAKVNMLFFSIIIGISQGLQPIVSFNYGARKYDRVKSSYILAMKTAFLISITAFLIFQFFPRQIVSLFGSGSELYYEFAVSYFRIFLFFTFLNFIQPITSNFFTAIEKPGKGILLSLTRQIIFLLPLMIIFPLFIGIDGIMYSGPVSDFMAAVTGIFLVYFELKRLN
ncbi:MAG: MATE family efflux transporter [Clostridium sp.]